VQTVKSGRALASGLSRTEEIDAPSPDGRIAIDRITDEALREELRKLLGPALLEPLWETRIKRTTVQIEADGARAELAIDSGTIVAGERSAPHHEMEIELICGTPADLFAFARRLIPAGGVRFSSLPKSARARRLARGKPIEPPPAPRKAGKIAPRAGDSVELAAKALLRDCLGQIAANVTAVRVLDSSEAPHQLRIGLRRLRTALRLYAPAIGSAEADRLGDEARWLGRAVSPLRDLEVASAEAAERARTAPARAGLGMLAQRLRKRADAERVIVRRLLGEERAQMLLIDLAAFVEAGDWREGNAAALDQTIEDFATAALDRLWHKTRKQGDRIDELDAEGRHAMRKTLKKLRYATDHLAPLLAGKAATRFAKRLRKLQDRFGAMNDAVMFAALLADPRIDRPGEQRAIGWMLGATREAADLGWPKVRRGWRRLDAAGRYWH